MKPNPSCNISTTPSPVMASPFSACFFEDAEDHFLLEQGAGVFDAGFFGQLQ